MSFGKPVVVSDVLAQKNIVLRSKSGLVHRAEDAIEFSNMVLKLYNNKELYQSCGENGKHFIENEFCWEKTSQKLIDLYDKLN